MDLLWGEKSTTKHRSSHSVLKSNRTQILLGSSSSSRGQMAESKPGVPPPPPPLWSVCHRFQEVFCGSFAHSNLQTGKTEASEGCSLWGDDNDEEGKIAGEQWGSRGGRQWGHRNLWPAQPKLASAKLYIDAPSGVTLSARILGDHLLAAEQHGHRPAKQWLLSPARWPVKTWREPQVTVLLNSKRKIHKELKLTHNNSFQGNQTAFRWCWWVLWWKWMGF